MYIIIFKIILTISLFKQVKTYFQDLDLSALQPKSMPFQPFCRQKPTLTLPCLPTSPSLSQFPSHQSGQMFGLRVGGFAMVSD